MHGLMVDQLVPASSDILSVRLVHIDKLYMLERRMSILTPPIELSSAVFEHIRQLIGIGLYNWSAENRQRVFAALFQCSSSTGLLLVEDTSAYFVEALHYASPYNR